ncbi:MAG: hypothetical protein LBJ25_04035 [Candidatus Margulisbacteria bacterium]|nr:hypothetical protein [Candidatus Margulisiibacteriota bacterium]
MKAEEYQNEIRLGNWIAHTAQTINNAEGSQRDWQYPEQQQAKFVKWYTQTPTGNQKQNADNLTAWKKFIVRYGYRPRQSISADARKKMTKTRYEQEVRLGKWANSVSQYLLPDWNQLVWQYQQQHDGFKELWQKTPTYNQKLNADKLILLQKFCRENGCRPSHDTSKKYPTIASAGEVSPEEDRLAVFVDTVRAGNSAFQYPEQYQAFEKCLSYPTRLAFQQKMDSRRFDRLATVP